MLLRVERQQPPALPAQDRSGVDHLGVQQDIGREAAQEEAAMVVGPVHHGSD
jgi:hypothetical protein